MLADECSRLPSTGKIGSRAPRFRLLFTATPIRSYLEDLIDLAELVMEFPDDGDTKGAALTSLDLVVHGLGFGNQKGGKRRPRSPARTSEISSNASWCGRNARTLGRC